MTQPSDLRSGWHPADAATASASGLDPRVSVENAARQIPRIAEARGLPVTRVSEFLWQQIQGRELGILGVPRVNVLELDLALGRAR